MDVHTNIPLKNYLTMHMGGPARFMADAHSNEEVANICRNAIQRGVEIFVLGGGSNVIARDNGFNGLVLRVRIDGFTVIAQDASSTTIKIGAGEIWDSVVERSVEMNLSGIESMSGIPGTAGATPVQNVGAYGQDISGTLQSLEAYDMTHDKFVTMTADQCEFSYRNSIFRDRLRGRYIILTITLKLSKDLPQAPFYSSVQQYLDDRGITYYTPLIIRNAVLDIRHDKLPDPRDKPNSGSFFKNVVVDEWKFRQLQSQYPGIVSYQMADGSYKIPTGWLIDQCGLKGKVLHGMRVNDKNALVLINETATGYNDLSAARDDIRKAVRLKFGLEVEQEPLEI